MEVHIVHESNVSHQSWIDKSVATATGTLPGLVVSEGVEEGGRQPRRLLQLSHQGSISSPSIQH